MKGKFKVFQCAASTPEYTVDSLLIMDLEDCSCEGILLLGSMKIIALKLL